MGFLSLSHDPSASSSWVPPMQVCATDHPNVLERVELEAKRVTSSLTLMQQQGLSASGQFGFLALKTNQVGVEIYKKGICSNKLAESRYQEFNIWFTVK